MKSLSPLIKLIYLGFVFFSSLFYSNNLYSQEGNQDSIRVSKILEKVSTIQNILTTIPALKTEIKQKREEQLNKKLTEEEKQKIASEADQLDHQLENLEKDLEVIASGIDQEAFFDQPSDPEVDINTELKEIFFPIIDDLKKATNRPREIERLRNDLANNELQLQQIEDALIKLKELNEYTKNSKVKKHLGEELKFWEKQNEELTTKSDAIRLHLEEKVSQSRSFLEVMKSFLRTFFQSHGKNLFFAFLALFGTFFVLRLIHRKFREKVRAQKSKNWQFVLRLTDLFYYIFTILASFTFFMMVLYSASDWLLLGISIVLLFGLLWVGKNAMPLFIEQGKLLLDLGPVREGERVIYKKIPWKVDSLNMYSYLSNPELEIEQIILPIKDLVGLRSRPFSEEEPWFPSSKGDWVTLDDGFFGQVVHQSPDTVELIVERGSIKSYSISDYLNNNPQNLSRNCFSIAEMIGIHYKYRDNVSEVICPKLEKFLLEKLNEEPYGKFVHQVRVELEKLNESSLDIEFFVKFDGEAASEFVELPGRIQQIALKGLNEMNIEIPYPHLTIDRV